MITKFIKLNETAGRTIPGSVDVIIKGNIVIGGIRGDASAGTTEYRSTYGRKLSDALG